jgi:SAM-dependent methyltransferase
MTNIEYERMMYEARIARADFTKSWYINSIQLLEKNNIIPKVFCDFGCSAGEFIQLMKKNYPNLVAFGADVIEEPLNHLKALGIRGFVIDGNSVKSLPSEYRDKFDLVSCLASVEHVTDADSYIQILNYALKPSGYCLLSIPNIVYGKYWWHAVRGGIPWKEGHHYRFWNLARLKQYTVLNGFRIVDCNHIWGDQIWRRISRVLKLIGFQKKRMDNSLTNNLGIIEFVFLLEKDIKFTPIGVAENLHSNLLIPEINKKHMKDRIYKELFERSCISKMTLDKLFRVISDAHSN